MIRPALIAALFLTGAVATPVVLVSNTTAKSPNASTSSTNGQGPKDGPDDATCDVTGVHTSYDAAYSPNNEGDYRISNVKVAGVDASCSGAQLEVTLFNGPTPIGTRTKTAGSDPTVNFEMTPPVPASSVDRVRVQITGGTTPVPGECRPFTTDRRKFGTLGDDANLVGTSRSDLMYGLTGNDRMRGGPNPDCIDGGEGNDKLFGEEGDDFLLGQAGLDELDGGNGRDRLFGGAENDILRGGSGNDHLDGGDGSDTCVGGIGTDTFSGCESITQ